MKQNENPNYIGIDVAKETLDVHRLPSNLHRKFNNSHEGWQEFLHWIKDEPPTLVLCEATGGYEKNFVIALAEAGIPFRVVKPQESETTPKASASSPRPIKSMRKSSHSSPPKESSNPSKCRTKRKENSKNSSSGGGS